MKVFFLPRRQVTAFLLLVLAGVLLSSSVAVHTSKNELDWEKQVIYQGTSGQKVIALDVNVDWGEEYIPPLLDILSRHNVKVTFFVTGNWAQKHPDMIKEMLRRGHDVENHGYRHVHLTRLADNQVVNEIVQAGNMIFDITGQKPTLFSPPYGEIDDRVTRLAIGKGYQVIMWSLDTIDWQRPSPDTITNRIVKRLHNDAIVLMHPTEPTVKALPALLEEIKAQGYDIKKVKEIIPIPAFEETGDSLG